MQVEPAERTVAWFLRAESVEMSILGGGSSEDFLKERLQ